VQWMSLRLPRAVAKPRARSVLRGVRNSGVLVSEHRTIKSRGSHGVAEPRSLGSVQSQRPAFAPGRPIAFIRLLTNVRIYEHDE